MDKMQGRCWAEIDLAAIHHNVGEIQKMIPATTKIMGIVKANAYGHGDIAITKELIRCGVDFFGVASMEEALALRDAGIAEPILILGYTPPFQFHYLHERNIIQTVISAAYGYELSAYAQAHDVKVHAHIKVDTGMCRLGIQCKVDRWDSDDVKAMYHLPHLCIDGIFSHFSVSDEYNKAADVDFTRQQIHCFDALLEELKAAGIYPGLTHLQNSYGIMNYPQLHYDYVRPGLLHLGVTSDDQLPTLRQPDFHPIMTWKARVVYVKEINADSSVSYGRHFTAPHPMRIATISCGYADGYPRIASNQGQEVLIHKQRAKIIGNICMDQMMVDVSHIDAVKEGDEVILFGYDHEVCLPVDELSRICHTINNETLCRLSHRVARVYRSS